MNMLPPSSEGLPPRHGNCRCACHDRPAIIHMVPCCWPSKFTPSKEWCEQAIKDEEGFIIAAGVPETHLPTINSQQLAELIYRLIRTCQHTHKVCPPEEVKDAVVGELGEFLTLFGRQVQNRAKPEDWLDESVDVILMGFQGAIMKGISPKLIFEMMATKLDKWEKKLATRGQPMPERP